MAERFSSRTTLQRNSAFQTPASSRHRITSTALFLCLSIGTATASAADLVFAKPPDRPPVRTLAGVPKNGDPDVGALIQQAAAVIKATREAEEQLKKLKLEHDGVKTKLTAAQGEVELVEQRRRQTEQQLAALERQQQERLTALRKDMEGRVTRELTQMRQELKAERERDFARQLQSFELRQYSAAEQTVTEEFGLKERELAQLSQEIEVQTRELADRLAQLEPDTDLSKSLQRATTQTVQKHKAMLEAKREQLQAQQEAAMAKQRADFIKKLDQQYEGDEQRRLKVKEASLRLAMAEMLHNARSEGAGKLEQARGNLEEARQRYNQLAQHHALHSTRAETITEEIESQRRRLATLDAERQEVMARLEETIRRIDAKDRPKVLAWFGRTVKQLPAEAAAVLGPMHQRLSTMAEQERQLAEQQRVLRERQLALELSREMEAKYRQEQERIRREREAKAKKTDDLLKQAHQLTERGKFDEALRLLSQAEPATPSQRHQLAVTREDIEISKRRAIRRARSADIEQIFIRAMKAFEAEDYEAAIPLFERVITEEAALDAELGFKPSPPAAPKPAKPQGAKPQRSTR
jgi:hypothetical protein